MGAVGNADLYLVQRINRSPAVDAYSEGFDL